MGEKRRRSCASKAQLVEQQETKEMRRRVAVLEQILADGAEPEEKVQKVLQMHEQSEAENRRLREQISWIRGRWPSGSGSGSRSYETSISSAFETPDKHERRPSDDILSPDAFEIPLDGPGSSEAAGKFFGILGKCEAALRGGALGNCEAAQRGGALGNCEAAKKGGTLTPEALEKCRQAGRENGVRGKNGAG